jgi:hypothetical protein
VNAADKVARLQQIDDRQPQREGQDRLLQDFVAARLRFLLALDRDIASDQQRWNCRLEALAQALDDDGPGLAVLGEVGCHVSF